MLLPVSDEGRWSRAPIVSKPEVQSASLVFRRPKLDCNRLSDGIIRRLREFGDGNIRSITSRNPIDCQIDGNTPRKEDNNLFFGAKKKVYV